MARTGSAPALGSSFRPNEAVLRSVATDHVRRGPPRWGYQPILPCIPRALPWADMGPPPSGLRRRLALDDLSRQYNPNVGKDKLADQIMNRDLCDSPNRVALMRNAPRLNEARGVVVDWQCGFAQLAMASELAATASELARAMVHSSAGTCRQAPLVQATKMSCTLPSNVRSNVCEHRSLGPMP